MSAAGAEAEQPESRGAYLGVAELVEFFHLLAQVLGAFDYSSGLALDQRRRSGAFVPEGRRQRGHVLQRPAIGRNPVETGDHLLRRRRAVLGFEGANAARLELVHERLAGVAKMKRDVGILRDVERAQFHPVVNPTSLDAEPLQQRFLLPGRLRLLKNDHDPPPVTAEILFVELCGGAFDRAAVVAPAHVHHGADVYLVHDETAAAALAEHRRIVALSVGGYRLAVQYFAADARLRNRHLAFLAQHLHKNARVCAGRAGRPHQYHLLVQQLHHRRPRIVLRGHLLLEQRLHLALAESVSLEEVLALSGEKLSVTMSVPLELDEVGLSEGGDDTVGPPEHPFRLRNTDEPLSGTADVRELLQERAPHT